MARKFKTREEWLGFVTQELRPAFKKAGFPIIAKVRFAIGFMGTGAKSKHIGECWDTGASADKTAEIFIRPDQDQPKKVANILAHELIHVAVGNKEGHKGKFKICALALGFEGKMTCTLPGAKMQIEVMDPILKLAGPLPHKKLNVLRSGKKKQGTRLLKAECGTCGYVVRVTAKWLELGAPYCGVRSHGRMVCEAADEGEGE